MRHKHLGIYLLACSEQGKILLIKKSSGPYTGTFDLPGGTPEFGETTLETVSREVLEETGLAIPLDKFKLNTVVSFTYDYEMNTLHHTGIIYTCSVLSDSIKLSTGDGIDSAGALWIQSDNSNLSPLASHALEQCKIG
ncbi:MAG: NUDIX domain-containing protein [Planctomycetes bacterium]|nr:NUDIX domain-containing protein [Planctomycetota bacterium]